MHLDCNPSAGKPSDRLVYGAILGGYEPTFCLGGCCCLCELPVFLYFLFPFLRGVGREGVVHMFYSFLCLFLREYEVYLCFLFSFFIPFSFLRGEGKGVVVYVLFFSLSAFKGGRSLFVFYFFLLLSDGVVFIHLWLGNFIKLEGLIIYVRSQDESLLTCVVLLI